MQKDEEESGMCKKGRQGIAGGRNCTNKFMEA